MRIVRWNSKWLPEYHQHKFAYLPITDRKCSTCNKEALYLLIETKYSMALCPDHAIAVFVRRIGEMEGGIMGLPLALAKLFVTFRNEVNRKEPEKEKTS